MDVITRDTITRLLGEAHGGSRTAVEALAPLLYGELRGLAAAHLRGERKSHTLQPTALVNEAWLRLVGASASAFATRLAFFAAASRAIRNVLVDHARRRGAQKRSHPERLDLIPIEPSGTTADVDLVALDEAMERLAQLDARQARVVELRFFGGLSVPETATALACSAATVKRDWQIARAWLYRELHQD